ncbi:hypothetical protein P154DRAFT_522052 [Amniculicola lignicola CBS 123094]|uniref:Ribosomal protein bL31m N-terminal domain-containing protein n=1 Tax=Amniculicola lignicola CBS 123094 TaxID=1392246 RepID=A0A6A5WGN4_9PLEO|nr:hypothetical protein P154DRAFT_522052 [Amniculicola lignicola CBS 123094]
MASPIPSPGALRLLRSTISSPHPHNTHGQIRHATLLRRPKRPYTFTQLITLSDGSSFLHRTTSPAPVYKSTKDRVNTPLWNPSSQKLLNVESDEAGRLRAFREKFGRGWDIDAEKKAGDEEATKTEQKTTAEPTDHLLDLISGYNKPKAATKKSGAEAKGSKAGVEAKGKK